MTNNSSSNVESVPIAFDYGWEKHLVIVRGPSGSGKTTLAESIVNRCCKDSNLPCGLRIIEADHFFMVDGRYQWSEKLLHHAHNWCQAEAFRRLQFFDVVAVANTFIRLEYIWPYILNAAKLHIRVWVVEPNGIDLSSEILSDRNIHSVPIDKIQTQIEAFEQITQAQVDTVLGLPEELKEQQFPPPGFVLNSDVPDLLKAAPPWEQ